MTRSGHSREDDQTVSGVWFDELMRRCYARDEADQQAMNDLFAWMCGPVPTRRPRTGGSRKVGADHATRLSDAVVLRVNTFWMNVARRSCIRTN